MRDRFHLVRRIITHQSVPVTSLFCFSNFSILDLKVESNSWEEVVAEEVEAVVEEMIITKIRTKTKRSKL